MCTGIMTIDLIAENRGVNFAFARAVETIRVHEYWARMNAIRCKMMIYVRGLYSLTDTSTLKKRNMM